MELHYTRHRFRVISRSYGHCFGTVCVSIRDYANETPLQLASQSDHRAVVQCFIGQGADVDSHSQDEDHNAPLSWGGHVDVVRVPLEYKSYVNSEDDNSRTP
jgi:ankyrin repeat protein